MTPACNELFLLLRDNDSPDAGRSSDLTVEQATGYVADGASQSFRSADSPEGRCTIRQRLQRDSLEVLNGSFAYICFDAETRLLHLVTDRMGTNPIYYAVKQDVVACGTDWKKVAWACDLTKLSRTGVTNLLMFGYCLAERTTVDQLHQCLPGTHYVLPVPGRAGAHPGRAIEKKRYWHYPHTDSIRSHGDFEKRMGDALRNMETRSVALLRDFNSEVLVKLSGGYDSRLAAAMLAKHIPIRCVSYGSRLYVDRILSLIVADEIGVPHIDCLLRGNELTDIDRTRSIASCVGARSLSYIAMGSSVMLSQNTARRYAWVPGFVACIAPGAVRSDSSIPSLECAVDVCIARHSLLRFGGPVATTDVSGTYVLFDSIRADIEESFRKMEADGAEPFWMLHRYDMENRQAHHILSDADFLRLSGRVVMPLFGDEMVELFDSCSVELLCDRSAYKRYLADTSFTLGERSRLGRIPCSELTLHHLALGVKPKFALDYALALAGSRIKRGRDGSSYLRRYVRSFSAAEIDSLIEEMLPLAVILREVLTDRGLVKLRASANWMLLDALYTLKHVQEAVRSPTPMPDSTVAPVPSGELALA